MSPPKTVSPVIASLKVSSKSNVLGCPGVPRSIPRIETVVELRSVNGSPFILRSVGLELRTIQKVSVPSTIGSNDTLREYKIYEDPLVFRPPVGEFSQELLGIDIPLLIPLSRDIISSGQFPHWNASTTHRLYIKVSCGDSYNTETNYIESFPIVIKLYDTLPLYRQFNEPIIETRTSNDQQILVDLSLPVSSVGPKDEFILFIKIMTNSLNNKMKKKIRLNKLTFQIKEVLECHEGGLPLKKEYKVFTKTKLFDNENNLLNTQGISYQFQLEFPIDNDYLQMYSNRSLQFNSVSDQNSSDISIVSSLNISKNKNIDKLDEGIPLTHTQGFTTLGKLFSIRYEVIIKIKFTHGKDMEIRLPITVSTYDRISSDYLLQWIMKECEFARKKFGKNTINRLVNSTSYDEIINTLRSFVPPPTIYKNTKADWVRLGFNGEAFGSNKLGKNLVQYID